MSTRTASRKQRNRPQPRPAIEEATMLDTDAEDLTAHSYEDRDALDDYQAHREEIERDKIVAILTHSLARTFFAVLTADDGNPDGAEVLAGAGDVLSRQHALDLLADKRLVITLADPS